MMDSSRSPPSPTFFPSTRLSSLNSQRTSKSQASTFSTSRSPPTSRPMSSSTHLLQDLEPRTYDSQSDAESYRDSPPTASQTRGGVPLPHSQPQPRTQGASRSRKWPKTRRFEGRSTYNDVVEAQESHTYTDSHDEQHLLDSPPEPIIRHRSRDEEALPHWARSTESGRRSSIPRAERVGTVKLEDVQPGWLKAQQRQETVKFSIPPPITESLMLPTSGRDGKRDGRGYKGSEESILSSILGAFPGVGRDGSGSGDVVGRNKTSRVGEGWMDIIRQEKFLQSQIQSLLDEQAEGLQAARTGGGVDGKGSIARSEGSMRSGASTRSSATLHGRNARMVAPGKKTLHRARMELWKSMYTLSDLAAAKEAVLTETFQSLEEAHTQLSTWQNKLNTADEKIREIGGEDQNDRFVKELHELDALIIDLERKLKVAKEKRKYVLRKTKEERSVGEADAARWVEVKREIDKEAGRWMKEPGIPNDMLEQDAYWTEFMNLPASRRNLDVATENLSGAIRGIQNRLTGAQVERGACERGAALWSEVLEVIMKSEKTIKGWMERSLQGRGDPLEDMINFMEETEGELQDKLDVAEREGWNLVVCALGAEVEAWREGGEIMRGMSGSRTSGKGKERDIELREGKTKVGRREMVKEEWKDMDDRGGETAEHSDSNVDPARGRGHSVNTRSTEDPMSGSGVDNDAELLGEPEARLGSEDKGKGPLIDERHDESNGGRTGMGENEDSGVSESLNSRPDGQEDYHGIITEGLNVSPSKSNSPVKGMLKAHENSQPQTPDREVSFRTAMEHSVNIGRGQDINDVNPKQMKERDEREESPEL